MASFRETPTPSTLHAVTGLFRTGVERSKNGTIVKKLLAIGIVICPALWAGAGSAEDIPNQGTVDIGQTKPDLVVPAMTEQAPGPGLRVKQTTSGYENTKVHHALYLPTDWQKGKTYPVIVEYAGNQWRTTSPGTVQGSNLGYGISGGKGFIWVCMPYLDGKGTANVGTWWGDPGTYQAQPTVDYCIKTVGEICRRYGGDPNAVILCGFSRGAIACNFIGLYNDEIAKLWRAFVCYSHYDGVEKWPYPGSAREFALERLKRLGGRPQFICCEAPTRGRDVLQDTKKYIESTGVKAPFTYSYSGFMQHDDAWTLRPCPAREALRTWVKGVLK